MFLLRRFSKYIIYIVLVINVRCINTINNDIRTDDVNNSKNTPSLIIMFRINDNIKIFNFSEVVNSNFFFEKRRFLKFYINGMN